MLKIFAVFDSTALMMETYNSAKISTPEMI